MVADASEGTVCLEPDVAPVTVSYDQLHTVWPSHDQPSIIRKHAVLILTEDPDQRLQLNHLAALLQLRMQASISPDALLSVLASPSSAGMFNCMNPTGVSAGGSSNARSIVKLQADKLRQAVFRGDSPAPVHLGQVLEQQRPQSCSSSSQVPDLDLQHCIQWIWEAWPPAKGDADAYLAANMALLLVFAGAHRHHMPPLQMPLPELLSALQSAAAHDHRLAAVLRGRLGQAGLPAAAATAGHAAAVEQLVVSLLSGPAVKPFFLVQRLQGAGYTTVTLNLQQLATCSPSDAVVTPAPQMLLPGWVQPSDLATGMSNLQRVQLAAAAVAPAAARRPSSGAATDSSPAGAVNGRQARGSWAIGPVGSTAAASETAPAAAAAPAGASSRWGPDASTAADVMDQTAINSSQGPYAADPSADWQQIARLNISNGGRQEAPAGAQHASEEAAQNSWMFFGTSPLSTACSEALFGIAALKAAATTAGQLSNPEACAEAAGSALSAAGDAVQRRSTWSGSQVGAAADSSLGGSSVGSVPTKSADGGAASGLPDAGSGASAGPGAWGGVAAAAGAAAPGEAQSMRLGSRGAPVAAGGHGSKSGGATLSHSVPMQATPASYGSSPVASHLSQLFMSGPGSFPTRGAGILSWDQSPRDVEVPHAIASCWSNPGGAPAAAGGQGSAAGGSGNNSRGVGAMAETPSWSRAVAAAAKAPRQWPNGSKQPSPSQAGIAPGVAYQDAGLASNWQQLRAAPTLGSGTLSHPSGGAEGDALGAAATSLSAAGNQAVGQQWVRSGSAWPEAAREDISTVSDTEQSSEGPELFFGALGSSLPGRAAGAIAGNWQEGRSCGRQQPSAAVPAIKQPVWDDADLPFELPDEEFLLEGLCEVQGLSRSAAAGQPPQPRAAGPTGSLAGGGVARQDAGALGGLSGAGVEGPDQQHQVQGQLQRVGPGLGSGAQGTPCGLYGLDPLRSSAALPQQQPSGADAAKGVSQLLAMHSTDTGSRSADTEKGQRKQSSAAAAAQLPGAPAAVAGGATGGGAWQGPLRGFADDQQVLMLTIPPPPPRRPLGAAAGQQQQQQGAAGNRRQARPDPSCGAMRDASLGQSPRAAATGVLAAAGPGLPPATEADVRPAPARNWASIAAKEPSAAQNPLLTPRSGATLRDHAAATAAAGSSGSVSGPGSAGKLKPPAGAATLRGSSSSGSGLASAAGAASAGRVGQLDAQGFAGGAEAGKVPLLRLPAAVRGEVEAAVARSSGILKVEDFDDGVVHQLASKRSEAEAVAAVRSIGQYELGNIQHMAAYLNHVIKNYHPPGAEGQLSAGGRAGAPTSQLRVPSAPVNNKAMLQKLPLKVYRRLEEVVAGCPHLDWHHFDAGVIKVLGQLSKIAEDDVFAELDLLSHADLSNVEYMPAYLNKRLNNKLWSRRKSEQ